MGNLIKTDLIRVLKDKLFLVLCILCVVFAFVTPLLYKGIMALEPMVGELLGENMTSPVGQFFSAFSLGNNFGPIAPILIVLILCKDFSHGTIRNKIISGHSRLTIMAAMYCVCAIVVVALIFIHAILTLLLSLALFPEAKSNVDAMYLVQSLAFELLTYLFIAAFLTWMWAAMKNTGLVIVIYVAAVFGFTLVASVVMVAEQALMYSGKNEILLKVLQILQNCNLFYSSSFIGIGTEYSNREILCYLLSPAIFGGGLVTLGFLSFRKRDLK